MRKTVFALSLTPILLSGCADSLLSLTGYTASMTCSKTFETGLNWQTIYQEDLSPITQGNVDMADITIDVDSRTVTSKALSVSKTAVYRPGLGCTLVGEDGVEALLQQTYPDQTSGTETDLPWPDGSGLTLSTTADYEKIEHLAAAHFSEFKEYQVNTHSLAVAHKGELIYEKYADGYENNTPIYGFSVAKTLASLFVGTLSDRQLIDIHEPIAVNDWQQDERKDITAHHLLTMSSGLDFSETYDDATSDANMLFVVDDMARFSRDQPAAAKPGEQFNYSTGDTMVLAGELKRILGGSLEATKIYLDHGLLSPVGIHNSVIQPDSVGNLVFGMQGLFSTHDMARMGQLILQSGEWNDQQIVSKDWIDYMTTPIGLPNSLGYSYGAGIWLNLDSNGRKFLPSMPSDTLIAFGLRGQFVIIVPSMELVVARTGSTLDAYDFIADMDQLVSSLAAAL